LTGGYKADMLYGLEDYDFWLSLISLEREVFRLPEVHFFYRKHGASMISNIDNEKLIYLYENIIKRHQDLYKKNIINMIIKVNSLNSRIKQLESMLNQSPGNPPLSQAS
jgi:hypothetical protein